MAQKKATAERKRTTTTKRKDTESSTGKSQATSQATKTRKTQTQTPTSTETTTQTRETKSQEVTSIGLTNAGANWGWEARTADGTVVQSSQMPHYNRHRAWNEARKMYPNAELEH